MKDMQMAGYCVGACLAAILLYNTWQFIIGALTIFGLWQLCNHNNRRPPRCR